MLDQLRAAGATDQIAALLARDPATHVAHGEEGLEHLLEGLKRVNAHDQIAVLAESVANQVILDDPSSVYVALILFRRMGAEDRITALLARDPVSHAILDQPGHVSSLLLVLRAVDATDHIATLLARDPASHVTVDHPHGLVSLLSIFRDMGAHDQFTALTKRIAAHFPVDDAAELNHLLSMLHYVERGGPGIVVRNPVPQMATLLARDPASHIRLDTSKGSGRRAVRTTGGRR